MLLDGMFYSVRYVYEIDMGVVNGRFSNVVQPQYIYSCRQFCKTYKNNQVLRARSVGRRNSARVDARRKG